MIFKLNIEAFAATPEVRTALETAKQDRAFGKSKVAVHEGGIVTAIKHYAEHPSPQVVLVEETGSDADLMAHLEALAEVVEAGTKVIVLGALNDIGVYRTLLSQGVSEYLVAPVAPRQIVDAVVAIFDDPTAPPRGRMIAFYGARGGVGTSTIAHNVAWALSKLADDDVIVVDLDIAFGTSGLAFNVEGKASVQDALSQPERVDSVLMERFMFAYDDHLQVLSTPGDLRATGPIDIDALEKILDLARQMAAFVVVDLPHQWNNWAVNVMTAADELVVVAQPDLPNLRDCKNIIDAMAARRGESSAARLLLNRLDAYKKTQLSPKDFQETLNVAPMMSIPFDPVVFGEAMNNGQMIGETAGGAKMAETFRQLATQLTGRQPAAKKKPKPSDLMGWLKLGHLGPLIKAK